MGMSYDQYWNQDCRLVIPYRKAYKIRQDEINNTAWLQGLYIWKALQTAPIFVNGFVPKGARIQPYFEKPLDFTPEEKKDKAKLNEQRTQDTIAFMERLAGTFNEQNNRKRKDAEKQKQLQEEAEKTAQQEETNPSGKE